MLLRHIITKALCYILSVCSVASEVLLAPYAVSSFLNLSNTRGVCYSVIWMAPGFMGLWNEHDDAVEGLLALQADLSAYGMGG